MMCKKKVPKKVHLVMVKGVSLLELKVMFISKRVSCPGRKKGERVGFFSLCLLVEFLFLVSFMAENIFCRGGSNLVIYLSLHG